MKHNDESFLTDDFIILDGQLDMSSWEGGFDNVTDQQEATVRKIGLRRKARMGRNFILMSRASAPFGGRTHVLTG